MSMSNTRKIRLIIDKNKTLNKNSGKGCNCGRPTQIIQKKENEVGKIEEIKQSPINNNNKLKFL